MRCGGVSARLSWLSNESRQPLGKSVSELDTRQDARNHPPSWLAERAAGAPSLAEERLHDRFLSWARREPDRPALVARLGPADWSALAATYDLVPEGLQAAMAAAQRAPRPEALAGYLDLRAP